MTSLEDRPKGDLKQWDTKESFTFDGTTYTFPFSPENIKRIKVGDVPDFDVLVATYPRSGTAKLLEICWLLLHGCDTERAQTIDAIDRHDFLELCLGADRTEPLEPPVVAKTHVPFQTAQKLVDSGKKIILGIRNPKDALVSYYHFSKMAIGHDYFPGNWRQFMDLYKVGKFGYGDYFDNVLPWWAEKDRDNMFVVTYEDLNANPLSNIRNISRFLGQDHRDEQLVKVAKWTSFTNMKQQTATNYTTGVWQQMFKTDKSTYMRKGVAGDWKNYFSDEDNEYIDGLCEARARPLGLTFTFD